MKTQTAVQNIIEKLKELRDLHPISGNLQERISRGKYVFAIQVAEKELETEKQQIIDFANKCQLVRDVDMDGNITFVNPAEFFESTYRSTNKETLK